jgi:hypothetical protein
MTPRTLPSRGLPIFRLQVSPPKANAELICAFSTRKAARQGLFARHALDSTTAPTNAGASE